jgi:hypothetical protein
MKTQSRSPRIMARDPKEQMLRDSIHNLTSRIRGAGLVMNISPAISLLAAGHSGLRPLEPQAKTLYDSKLWAVKTPARSG